MLIPGGAIHLHTMVWSKTYYRLLTLQALIQNRRKLACEIFLIREGVFANIKEEQEALELVGKFPVIYMLEAPTPSHPTESK